MLKYELKETIEFLGKKYDTIEGVSKANYMSSDDKGDLATYNGKIISLGIAEDEDKSLFKHVLEQIEEINKQLEVQ
jgi:hypothetical protein